MRWTVAATAALIAAAPAAAVVVVGTTDFGTLPVGAFTGAAPGYFPATSDTSAAGRQAQRYTFTLTAPTHLYIGTV